MKIWQRDRARQECRKAGDAECVEARISHEHLLALLLSACQRRVGLNRHLCSQCEFQADCKRVNRAEAQARSSPEPRESPLLPWT